MTASDGEERLGFNLHSGLDGDDHIWSKGLAPVVRLGC
jgi:hypothetical protein